MQELGYFLFFLAVWFVIPYLVGSLLLKQLKKKWRWIGGNKRIQRVASFFVLLLFALVGWFIENLVLTGIKMIL